MNVGLVEIVPDQVAGLNRGMIAKARQWNPKSKEQYDLVRPSDLKSCIGGIFQQLIPNGYVHLPLEKMAGLLLHRIAEGQFFKDGNKRTALLSAVTFLQNNGHRLRVERDIVRDLMWGFAKPMGVANAKAKYGEADAIQFIFDNILPII